METSNERGSGFTHKSVALLHYYFQRIDIRRAESYIISPDWISKKATINPKNEKDNECFKWSIIAGLNYNKIKVVLYHYFIFQKKWTSKIFFS